LTDEPYFQGSADYLRQARNAVDIPVLRKDFLLEPWQIYESRAMGADCVLLIMAALTDNDAHALEELALSLDLDVLVEVHDHAELDRALCLQTRLIGVNNRNLKTLETDINTTLELAAHVPPDRFMIGESGLRDHADLQKLAGSAVHCFLVGESLMRQQDVEAATRKLLFG
jgi:indole-3-glycerol phosphate synthase